jgi:hypothetical protein
MSKAFPKTIARNFDVRFSSIFLVLSRFRVFLSDGSSKTQQQRLCKTNRVEKNYKTIDKKTDLFSRFVITSLGVSRWGCSKAPQSNIEQTNLTHTPTTGSPGHRHRLFLGGASFFHST